MSTNKFLDEIYEQPAALKGTLDFYLKGAGKKMLAVAAKKWQDDKTRRILFTGMGSSFFISNLASTILNRYGIPSQAVNAGELIHYQFPAIGHHTLVICISQSGESFEILRLLEKISPGIECIAISNEADSTLARRASAVLLSRAGKEYMTSTKTFTSTALVAIIFTLALAGEWTAERITLARSLTESVNRMILNHAAWLEKAMELINDAKYIQLVGRGPSMAAVQQGALMLMEGARIPASGLFSGEFRHGPMEMVKKDFLMIIIAPDGETYQQHLKLAGDIIHFEGKVIFVSNKQPRILSDDFLYIDSPCDDENFFSIPAILPLQFMVNECAVRKGSIPGEFIRGSKVTTTE